MKSSSIRTGSERQIIAIEILDAVVCTEVLYS